MGVATAIIGGGAMGAAIARGLIQRGLLDPGDVTIVEIVAERRAALTAELGAAASADLGNTAAAAELIVLAVKPQNFADLAADLRPRVDGSALVLSIMAGVTLKALREGLRNDRIVRVMPNIAAQVGRGASVWIADRGVTAADRSLARRVLEALGAAIEIEREQLIDAATAVHGSGPAYVYLLAEAWIDAAAAHGLERPTAELLVRETIAGAAALWEATGQTPAELRAAVTSPGGTTAAALQALAEFDIPQAMQKAITAAVRRAEELA